ncbi:MAG: alpha/beta hydrolase [Gaiellales bacterium]
MPDVVTSDGVRLRSVERGAGPPIVLVHGWKASHRIWDRTIASLEGGFRTIAYDLRGMGGSEKPSTTYDFAEHASDLAAVLEHYDVTDATLVAWSMGCSVALEHMRAGGGRVGRLVLVNGPVKLVSSDDFPWSLTQAELDAYLHDLEQRWPEGELEFQRATFHEPVDHVVRWILDIALQTPLDVVLKAVRAQALLDHREVVRTLRVPVLAIYGRHDPYYPVELADWIARTAPDGRAEIMERSAHFPFLEPDSSAFNELVARFARFGVAGGSAASAG